MFANKVVTKEEALSKIHDGQTIMFGDWNGEFAADEIIAGMLEKGIKASGIEDGQFRFVTNHDVTREDVDHVIACMKEFMAL